MKIDVPIAPRENVPTANPVCLSPIAAPKPSCRTLSKPAVTTIEQQNANPQNPTIPSASIDVSRLPCSNAVTAS